MDVKSAFLNGPLQEEVYVEQPPGFEDSKFPNHVYKLHKVLYGLKQAHRAWYEFLKDFLLKNGFAIGKADSTLFIQRNGKDIFICQIYVDDIIILYLCASRPDIMLSVCMCARFQANPKECHLMAIKRIFRYLVHTPNLGLWYPKGFTFDLLGYFDSDYAGCKVDQKSTTGTCQFLGRSLLSWSSKKQNSVALSMAKAEYVAAGACCTQLLWMKQTLSDYGCEFSKIPLLCDNESTIKLANNPVQHSRTKHIDI
jgi:hypothetical protein